MTTISQYLAKIGRKGGQASTPAKSEASRLNGKKGGRPKKANCECGQALKSGRCPNCL